MTHSAEIQKGIPAEVREKTKPLLIITRPTHDVATPQEVRALVLREINPDIKQILNPRFNVAKGKFEIACVNPNRCTELHSGAA